MNTRSIAALTLAAIALVLLIGTRRGRDAATSGGRAEPAARTEAVGSAAMPGDEASMAAVATRDQSQREVGPAAKDLGSTPATPWAIGGRLRQDSMDVQPAPSPARGVNVDIVLHRGYGTDGEIADRGTATVDASGSFTWQRSAPDVTVTAVATARPMVGFTFARSAARVAVLGEGPPPPLTITYQPLEHRIDGVVRDATTGDAIEGAEVRFNSVAQTTDRAGIYRLHVPAAGYGGIIARAAGYQRGGATPGKRTPGEVQTIDIELTPNGGGWRFFGQVLGPAGERVTGATVNLAAGGQPGVTDATGTYEATANRLFGDGSLRIEVEADGYSPTEVTLAAGEIAKSGTRVDVALIRGLTVEGTVRAAGGALIRGAELRLGSNPMLVKTPRTYSQDDGTFVFKNIPRGKLRLGARKRGFAAFDDELDLRSSPDGATVTADVTMAPELALKGNVVDGSGEPVAGARVKAMNAESVPPGRTVGFATTGDDGRFVIEGLGDGPLTLEVNGIGLAGSRTEVPRGTREVELVALRSTRLFGRVTDAATGAPIEQFKVRLTVPEDSAKPWFQNMEISWVMGGRTFGDPNGLWSTDAIDPIRPGGWTGVEVEAEGYEVFKIEPFQVPARGEGTELACPLVRVK